MDAAEGHLLCFAENGHGDFHRPCAIGLPAGFEHGRCAHHPAQRLAAAGERHRGIGASHGG